MKFRKTPIAVAVLAASGLFAGEALAQSTPAPGSGSLDLWFKAPRSGATVSGTLSGTNCYLAGSGVARVQFFLDNTALNTDSTMSDGMQCVLDTRKFSNGTHQLKATATSASGATRSDIISITINNATNTAPSVSFGSPAVGTVSGTVNYSVNVADDKAVTRVVFKVDGTTVADKTAAPWSGSLNTTTLANGAHTITATAYDAEGLNTTASRAVTVSNVPPNTAPSVSFGAPAAGTVSGTVSYSANVADDKAVTRVVFKVDGTTVADRTAAPWSGSLNTTTLVNGAHTITATAYDAEGLNTTASRAVTVSNVVTPPPPPPGATTPPPGSGSLDVWFKAPKSGNTVSGVLTGTNCYVAGTGVTRVAFRVDSTALNTDTTMSDGMQCVLDTTKLSNGTHTVTATATGSNGATRNDVISINVQNGTTPPPPPSNAAPTVSFTSPAAGAAAGTISYAASAADDKAVTRVVFKVDGTTIADKTAAPWSGSLNTTTLTNAAHSLTATAYDAEGLNTTATVALNVNNATTPPVTPPSTGGLPSDSTGVSGVATFESIGLYWAAPGASTATGCKVQFRRQGESAWRDGLDMWFDSRNSECRGSLVHLTPGTSYEVQMGLPGQSFKKGLTVATWNEQYPIASTVTLTPGSGQINITQGGTKDGYVLYTAAPGTVLDVNNSADYNVLISAKYVIVRGLTLRGARMDGIRLNPGSGDVVIEGNDISNWGRSRSGSLGVDYDSGIKASCTSSFRLERVVVQRNRIHDPRYGSNDWSSGHPIGPQATTFSHCGGNHVFRYNEIYSSAGKYFNDGIGGEDNFSDRGFPYADTDIYGNKISGAYDDAIEVEGANRNVRIWGNYTDGSYTGVASTVTHVGPFYVFRNVTNSAETFAKSGEAGGYGGGRRYFFHNTTLGQANEGIKGNSNQPMTNSWTRNNVLQLKSSGGIAVGVIGGSANDVDYDLSNGSMSPYSGAQSHGIVGTPTYVSGHGPANGAGGNYQLAPGSRGAGTAARIPNFNDAHATPDMGAHQTGTPAMKFGVQ